MPSNGFQVERPLVAKRKRIGPELMLAVLAEYVERLNQPGKLKMLADPRRVDEDAKEAAFRHRATGPAGLGVVGEPVVSHVVMHVARMEQGDEHVDVEQRDRRHSSSSSHRLTSSQVMNGAPGR